MSFGTQISVIYDKSSLFFLYVGTEILQSLLFILTLHIDNSAYSTRLYSNYPPAKYISRVKNACADLFIKLLHKQRLSPVMIHITCLLMTFSCLSRLADKTLRRKGRGVKMIKGPYDQITRTSDSMSVKISV